MFSCVKEDKETCTDGIKNGKETDIDCGGDCTPCKVEENFFDDYLISTGFNQNVSNFINSGDYEFGLEFRPIVDGYITSLRIQLPDTNPSLRVTIWDKAAGTIIKTEIVNVAAANTIYNVDIVDLLMVKDKEYTITMNSNDWYNRNRNDGSAATYPFTIGNIQIINYLWNSGTAQNYPLNYDVSYFAGDISFNFLKK